MYSLACAQMIVQKNKKKSVLIYASRVIPSETSFDASLWFEVYKIHYTNNHFSNLQSLMAVYKSHAVVDIYVSNVTDHYERVIVSKHNGGIYLIDDGLAMVALAKFGIGFTINRNLTRRHRAKMFLYKLFVVLRYKVKLVESLRYKEKIVALITSFPIKTSEFEVRYIDNPFSCNKKLNQIPSIVYFIGQNYFDNNDYESIDNYYNFILKIKKNYNDRMFKFYYFPHPREKNLPDSLISSVVIINVSIENYLCNYQENSPEVIGGLTSTALINLSTIKYPAKFEVWQLPASMRSDEYDVLIEWIEEISDICILPTP